MSSQSDVESELAALKAGTTGGAGQQALEQGDTTPPAQVEAAPVSEPGEGGGTGMIVRILGEGQWDVSDEQVTALNELDSAVESAVEAGDRETFSQSLDALLDAVRSAGVPLADESLEDSDLILPPGRRDAGGGAGAAQRRRADPGLMAKTRFINDRGLTARMTLVMFLLGGLFVALVVGLMFAAGRDTAALACIIGIAGIGIAWFQWYNSDKVALKAMRAREVTPGGGARAARHDRPALRARGHAQADASRSPTPTCRTPSPPAARRATRRCA